MSSQGARPPACRPRVVAAHPWSARAYSRCELLRHGRHVRPQGRQLHRVVDGGAAYAGRDGAAACVVRIDRMQHLPDADGRRRRQRTLHPVQYLALAYGLMPELAALSKSLFAVWYCHDARRPSFRGPATWRGRSRCRRNAGRGYGGRLAAALGRAASETRRLNGELPVAVDAEFAGDNQVLREGAEVALLPPVSGG